MLLTELGVCTPFRHRAIGAVLNKRCGAVLCIIRVWWPVARRKNIRAHSWLKNITHILGEGEDGSKNTFFNMSGFFSTKVFIFATFPHFFQLLAGAMARWRNSDGRKWGAVVQKPESLLAKIRLQLNCTVVYEYCILMKSRFLLKTKSNLYTQNH